MSWDWLARLDSRIAPPNCTRVVLDSLVSIRYNKHIKGVAIKTAPPYEQFLDQTKKSSLGRVAVSAFYRDRDG